MKTWANLACAIAAVVTLAFCAPNANATPDTLTAYSDLNIQLIVLTNTVTESSGTHHYLIQKVHLANKEVLKLLEGSDFYNGTFPAGAKLVVGWGDYDGDVLVVDSTGTTVFYNATTGTLNSEVSATLSFEYDEDAGPISGTVDGYGVNLTCFMDGKFKLYDYNANSGLQLDIEAQDASSTEHFNQHINSTEYTSWSDSEKMIIGDQGNQFIDDFFVSAVKGTITADGHGTGKAPGGLPQFPD